MDRGDGGRREAGVCGGSASIPKRVLACALLLAQAPWGCASGGAGEPTERTAVKPFTAQVTSASGAGSPPVVVSTAGTAGVPEEWTPASADVMGTFASVGAGVRCPLYMPTVLPPGTRAVAAGVDGPSGEGLGAELAVDLLVPEGIIHVREGVAADVGDAAARPCGSVAGRPAVVYPMSGGTLVQWSDHGWWYGVYSGEVSEDTVIKVATSMSPEAP